MVRHKRRKLTISPVEVDPDAETKQQEALATVTANLAALGTAGSGGAAGSAAAGPSPGAAAKAIAGAAGGRRAAQGTAAANSLEF